MKIREGVDLNQAFEKFKKDLVIANAIANRGVNGDFASAFGLLSESAKGHISHCTGEDYTKLGEELDEAGIDDIPEDLFQLLAKS